MVQDQTLTRVSGTMVGFDAPSAASTLSIKKVLPVSAVVKGPKE